MTFLSRKHFEVVLESKRLGFVMLIERDRRKAINHDFVQGQGNPTCQRFAKSGLQIFDTWVDSSLPVQSRGRFL